MISLPYVIDVAVTLDGNRVAYVVRTADWEKNHYRSDCFINDIARNQTRKVAENTRQPRWSVDQMLFVLHWSTDEDRNKPQIWRFNAADDCLTQLTFTPHGVQKFWLYSEGVIYSAQTKKSALAVERERRYGSFIHVEKEPRADALFYQSLANEQASPLRLTDGLPSSQRIRDLCPSDGSPYLNCRLQADYDAVTVWRLSTNPVRLESLASLGAGDKVPAWEQVGLPKQSAVIDVEPNGERVLLNWDGGRSEFFSNEPWALWTCSVTSDGALKELLCLTEHLKGQILEARWTTVGIIIRYLDSTVSRVGRLDEAGQLEVFDFGKLFPVNFSGFDIAKTGAIAFTVGDLNRLPEVVVADTGVAHTQFPRTSQITEFSRLCERWNWGTVETIHWNSCDDTRIEGVLFKPADFNPRRKYPLVVVVHGGPATASLQLRLDYDDRWYYPTLQFLAREILVLKPNYRGSDGRGHDFLELSRGNLGSGELWDVESGVDYLIQQGYVDAARVGCAGYSHGGFVSAFVATHSDRFVAASVGAGVTNWTTYYATSDFHRFAEGKLGGLPHHVPEAYRRASPTTAIGKNRTPTLIQHGECDSVVDSGNAQDLYRGLVTEGIWVEFFKYPGMGHSVPATAPRASRAVMSQNLKWFCHHLLGMPLNWDKIDELE